MKPMTKDQILIKISKELQKDEKVPEGWTRIMAFGRITDSMKGANLLVYTDEGLHGTPTSPTGTIVRDLFAELREVMAKENPKQEKWVLARLQMDAKGKQVEMDTLFEYEDVDRWRIRPKNMNEVIAEFRPKLRSTK